MRGCREVRRFAADPIAIETLQRIIEASLETPFVGEMPPWHFILVTPQACVPPS
jgi:nitroreductase